MGIMIAGALTLANMAFGQTPPKLVAKISNLDLSSCDGSPDRLNDHHLNVTFMGGDWTRGTCVIRGVLRIPAGYHVKDGLQAVAAIDGTPAKLKLLRYGRLILRISNQPGISDILRPQNTDLPETMETRLAEEGADNPVDTPVIEPSEPLSFALTAKAQGFESNCQMERKVRFSVLLKLVHLPEASLADQLIPKQLSLNPVVLSAADCAPENTTM
jgi:hypothetical protein